MGDTPVLTVAVPAYNMEAFLEKNLLHFSDSRLIGKVEIICLNNSSQDKTEEIAARFCKEKPMLFSLVTKENRGYGSSVNLAVQIANGTYFRIVDADDWVETEELLRLAKALDGCCADAVFTDYEINDAKTGKKLPVVVKKPELEYGRIYTDLKRISNSLPSMHATCYRTELLKRNSVELQENLYYVDEEFTTLPYLHVKSYVFFPFKVYQYRVGNSGQSMSPENRAKYYSNREQVLKRLIGVYLTEMDKKPDNDSLSCLYERIRNGTGDHFTTLYMYIPDRKTGCRLAREWEEYVKNTIPQVWKEVRVKKYILQVFHAMNMSLNRYEKLKRIVKFSCKQHPFLTGIPRGADFLHNLLRRMKHGESKDSCLLS